MAREAGNDAFRAGDFATAVARYSDALAAEPSAALLSNRSAAHAGLRAWTSALADADAAVALDAAWTKAHFRRGTALSGLGRYADAADAYAAAEAASQPGSAEAAQMQALRLAAARHAAMLRNGSGGGKELVCDARVDNDELARLCAAVPSGELVALDTANTPEVTSEGILAALRSHGEGLRALVYGAMSGTPDTAALRAAAPHAALQCVTESIAAAMMTPLAPSNLIASEIVAPMRARPDSALLAMLGGMTLGMVSFQNSAAAGEAGGAEVLVACLENPHVLDVRTLQMRARLVFGLASGLKNVAALCPLSAARALAAGAPRALLAALPPHASDSRTVAEVFAALNTLNKVPASAEASYEAGVVPALCAALAAHCPEYHCTVRVLSQLEHQATHCADARLQLRAAGVAQMLAPFRGTRGTLFLHGPTLELAQRAERCMIALAT